MESQVGPILCTKNVFQENASTKSKINKIEWSIFCRVQLKKAGV